MNNKTKFSLLIFVIVLVLSIFFRLKIVYELPLGITANEYGLTGFDDEPAHFNYTKYILEKNELPVLENKITSPDALEINEFEYHQPPLYYLIIATTAKTLSISNDHTILLLGRFLNLILSLISIIIFYKIFRYYDWHISKIVSTLSIFLLLGSSVYQMSVFGNDALSWFIFWYLFLLVLNEMGKKWISIIIVLTLLHYTKSSVLVFYPILLIATYKEMASKNLTKSLFIKYASIFILPFIFSFPWYLRNFHVYGSFFSMSTITGESWYFVHSLKESLIKLMHMPYLFLFRMHFDPPKPLLSWFNLIPYIWFLSAGIYAAISAVNILKDKYATQLLNFLLIIVIAAYLYYAIPTGYTEGRFLYPALPAILYFMTEVIYSEKIVKVIGNKFQPILIVIILLPSFIIGFFM